jgi:hypothetical protein
MLGIVLLIIGIFVIPIGTTIMVRGLEQHEVRFTMPNEMEIAAETGVDYNVVQEFLNVFRTEVQEVEQSKFLPMGVDVLVEDFNGERFMFWIQFGYIAAGSALALLFSISGLVCSFIGYTRLTYRDPMGIHSEQLVQAKKAKAAEAEKAKAAANPKTKKRVQKSFMGMRSS